MEKGILKEAELVRDIYLQEKGFWLIPLVLTVGDYVLSDDICVERKSVSTGDLYESFKSGRLLSQITNMNRYYKRPILLIEFDESIPFRLNDPTLEMTTGGEVNPTSIISKLSLLSLHFPNLAIIWSKSPSHTADIFKELKKT
jgi:DNA excision repair protein ERCC-4